MLLIHCPYCDEMRPELEFRYAGEAHILRPAAANALSDEAWGEYLYHRSNTRGAHRERWRHVHGCGRFFNALRDTASDVIIDTYRGGEARDTQPEAREVPP